jgi:hypothetical protein
MSDNRKYAQLQPFTLAGSGAVVGATSILINAFNSIEGVPLAMTDFGTKGFITLEPGSLDFEEQISFTGVVQNANGTATLSGVKHVDFLYPYTEASGLSKAHGGGVTAVVSNTSAFYDGFANKNDTETITQQWTFPSAEADRPKLDADTDALAAEDLVDFGQLSRTAMAGTVNASETVNGVVQLATNAQMGTATSLGSTGARLVPPNDQLVGTSAGAADAHKLPTLNASGFLDESIVKVDQVRTWSTVQSFTADNLQVTTDANSANDAVRKSLLDSSVAAVSAKLAFLAQSTSATTQTGNTAEANLFSLSIPGNTLGSNGTVRARFWLSGLTSLNGDNVLTLRIKYGSTTMIAFTLATSNIFVAGTGVGYLDLDLYAAGATNSQAADALVRFTTSTAFLSTAYSAQDRGLAVENSTGALNLVITSQWSGTATTNDSITLQDYVVEKIIS